MTHDKHRCPRHGEFDCTLAGCDAGYDFDCARCWSQYSNVCGQCGAQKQVGDICDCPDPDNTTRRFNVGGGDLPLAV